MSSVLKTISLHVWDTYLLTVKTQGKTHHQYTVNVIRHWCVYGKNHGLSGQINGPNFESHLCYSLKSEMSLKLLWFITQEVTEKHVGLCLASKGSMNIPSVSFLPLLLPESPRFPQNARSEHVR